MESKLAFNDIFASARPLTCSGSGADVDMVGGEDVIIVGAGRVNLFAQQQEDGRDIGPRIFVCSVESGQIALPFPGSYGGRVRVVVAAEQGSDVRALSLSDVASSVCTTQLLLMEECLGRYVSAIEGSVPHEQRPTVSSVLKAGSEHIFEHGQACDSADRTVWVEGPSMLSFVSIDPTVNLGATPVAVTPGSVILNKGDVAAAANCLSSEDMARSGRLSAALTLMLGTIAEGFCVRCQQARTDFDVRQLRKRVGAKRQLQAVTRALVDAAVGEFGDVEGSAADSHVRAFRAVAIAGGIVVRPNIADWTLSSDPAYIAIAQAAQLRSRPVKLAGRWWHKDMGPLLGALLPSGDIDEAGEAPDGEDPFLPSRSTPVALLPTAATGGYVMRYWDDGEAFEVPVDRALAARIHGQGLMLYRPLPEESIGVGDFIRFGLEPCKRDALRIVVGSLLAALLFLIVPITTGSVVDTVIPSGLPSDLMVYVGLLVGIFLAISVAQFFVGIAILRLVTRSTTGMIAALVDKITRLPASFFRRYTSGQLTSMVMGLEVARLSLTQATLGTIVAGIFATVNLLLMAYYSWRMTLVALVAIILLAWMTRAVLRSQLKWERKIQDGYSTTAGIGQQILEGIEKVKVTASEQSLFGVWGRQFAALRVDEYKKTWSKSLLEAVSPIVLPLATGAVFWIYVFYVQDWSVDEIIGVPKPGSLSTGDFLSFNTALSALLAAVSSVCISLLAIVKVLPIVQQSEALVSSAIEAPASQRDPGRLRGEIELSGVRFGYDPELPDVLKGVSFTVKPGEFVALVGGSGSGKSTIFRLLLGLEEAQAGDVLYDGVPLSELSLPDVRKQIGTVMQNGRLLAGDIRDNILGTSMLPIERAWEAAAAADIKGEIEEMPMGMFTVVNAGTLSGGQRQRVMIAQALVGRPPILLFDEATSALDEETQARVAGSVDRLNATRVVIAHRLSTIKNADRIIVLDQGKVVQEGAYEDLAAREGLFQDLIKRQIA